MVGRLILFAGAVVSSLSGAEVTLNKNGALEVDGKPFLPIFVWLQPTHLFKFHKQLGINTIMGEGAQSGVSPRQFLDACKENGLWGIIHFNEANRSLRDHPALLLWMFGDEPDLPSIPLYEPPVKPREEDGSINIWWEGESAVKHNFRTGSWMDRRLKSQRLSGRKWLSCYWEDMEKKNVFTARWEIEVPKEAAYTLWVREFNKSWASPCWWRFDNSEWEHTSRTLRALELEKIATFLSIGWVKYGEVKLSKGKHTFEMKVSEVRTAGRAERVGNDGMIAIDAILLTTRKEPPLADKKPPSPRRPPETLKPVYEELKRFDTRPVYLNLTVSFYDRYKRYQSSDQLYRGYISVTDIIGYDHYPVYGWGKPGRVPEIAYATAKLVELTDGKKPVWTILECTGWGQWTTFRPPTPEEVKAEVWMAIVNGAKGIGYFPHIWKPRYSWCKIPEPNQRAMKETNALLTELAPLILSEESKLKFELKVAEPDPVAFTEGRAVPTRLRPLENITFTIRETDTSVYLFAVNLTREACVLTVKLPFRFAKALRYESKKVLTKDSVEFSDILAPLGVAIYRLKKK